MFRSFSVAHPQGPTEKSRRVWRLGALFVKILYFNILCMLVYY